MKKNLAIFSLITLIFSALAPVSINTQAALSPELFTDVSDVVAPPVKVAEKEDKNPVDVSDVKSAPVVDKVPNTDPDIILPEIIEVPEVPKLIISKTANTSYTRSWDWSIEKTGTISNLGTVDASDVETVSYTITPTAESEDSNHKVYGTITVTNPYINAAFISSITDVMNDVGPVSIDCGVSFPYILMPNSTLNCSYVSTSSLADTQNTVTVTTTGVIQGGVATVPVVWGQPTTEYDKCITITDSHPAGPQKAKYCIEGQKVDLTYDLTFSKDAEADVRLVCGANEFTNTVEFTSKNTRSLETSDWKVVVSDSPSKFPKIGSDEWKVTANIDCAPPPGGGGGSGGGGGGGGGFIPTNVTNTPPTPPVDSITPDQQVLGEQRFADDPTSPQVLGVQVTAAPSFPKTGSGPANHTNNVYSYLMSGLMLLAASWMAYSRKEFSLSSK